MRIVRIDWTPSPTPDVARQQVTLTVKGVDGESTEYEPIIVAGDVRTLHVGVEPKVTPAGFELNTDDELLISICALGPTGRRSPAAEHSMIVPAPRPAAVSDIQVGFN